MRLVVLALLAPWLLVLAACMQPVSVLQPAGLHPLDATLWDVARAEPITPETLTERLRTADFAILGETHDNPVHHARQAWLLARLGVAGIAFEMVPEASEEGIQVFLDQGGTRAEIGPAIGWARLGWPDWSMYAPVFAASESAYIAGAGVARLRLTQAMAAGAARAFGTGARAYGLDRPLDTGLRRALQTEMAAAFCDTLTPEMTAGMVEAQRLRGARMAHALRRAAAAGGGRAVLVAGNVHARRGSGVPGYLRASAPETAVLSLGQIEVVEGAESLAAYTEAGLDYDYVWFSNAPTREDPCVELR